MNQNLMVNILWKIRFESTNYDLRILALNSWDKIRFIISKTIKLNRRLIMNCRVNLGSFESEQSQEFNCLACVIVAVGNSHNILFFKLKSECHENVPVKEILRKALFELTL